MAPGGGPSAKIGPSESEDLPRTLKTMLSRTATIAVDVMPESKMTWNQLGNCS